MDVISIVVPVYNAEKYLDDCIKSIIDQSYPAIELLLINDGSKDGSRLICEKYQYDKRVKVINKENGGVQSARTLGVQSATGRYVTFVDADDVLEKDTYRLVMEAFDKHDPDMVFFKYTNDFSDIHLRDDAPVHIHDEQIVTDMYDNFMAGAYMGGVLWDKVWKRETLDGIEFRTDMQICEDAVYVWDSLKNLKKAVGLPDKLYHYRYFQTSMSKGSSPAKYMKALPAWDYLKEKASSIGSASLPSICCNRIVWNLKAVDCLAISGNKEYDWKHLRDNILEEKQYYGRLSKYNRISVHVLGFSWALYKVWLRVERGLKKIYIRFHC
ncbi:MAG: glycosyltransferase [Lachnospiraceae bacterium]|nr:glycosyltransferase [Lachnospiraceae bacterium]